MLEVRKHNRSFIVLSFCEIHEHWNSKGTLFVPPDGESKRHECMRSDDHLHVQQQEESRDMLLDHNKKPLYQHYRFFWLV
jgi:hypothetical protein